MKSLCSAQSFKLGSCQDPPPGTLAAEPLRLQWGAPGALPKRTGGQAARFRPWSLQTAAVLSLLRSLWGGPGSRYRPAGGAAH